MKSAQYLAAISLSLAALAASAQADDSNAEFQAGYADGDITPPAGLPMWGYGARHAMTATGALDKLEARAVVFHAGDSKLTVVGLDLGRGPTSAMMKEIRAAVKDKAGIEHVLISGSHTHHGPVIELVDEEGMGKGTFDKAVAYSQELPGMLVDVILAADESARPARIGVGYNSELNLNRNRQSKRPDKAVDPTLSVVRIDDTDGNPISVIVNFAAHPVMTDAGDLRYSADYPGYLARRVKAELNAGCVFMQGASGDMSCNPPADIRTPEAFGELLAGHVLMIAEKIETSIPDKPSVAGRVDSFVFESRVNFNNPMTQLLYSAAFFPELILCTVAELANGIPAELNTVLLNGNIAMVGGAGEFFCNHGLRLKERSYVDHTLFFGYCNGHVLYFPTIEAVSEGGYGADKNVSPVEIGAGEKMMNQALINIYTMKGLFPPK